jgi:ElaB/YqjD/DUF883 family membrane-anchored ribosome-binding protein
MDHVTGEISNKSAGTKQNLGSFVHDASDKMSSMATNVVDTASDYVKSGTSYVTENPVKGVAIAAAAGAVVGSLLTLTMRRKK